MELFGNPSQYEDELDFILENIDENAFGKDAYFCQNDKCEQYGKGEVNDKLEGEVDLFVPPFVKVKGDKRTYLPAAAYSFEKKKDDKFTVEESEKNAPKVIVELEKESFSLAKDGETKDLEKPESICVTKGAKATLKSSNGDWTLIGDACATEVDGVKDVKVAATDKDDEAYYTFDISTEGNALPLQMENFDNQPNKELLEKYKKFLGDALKDEIAIQYASFPNEEPICFGNGSVPQKTNEVPTDPPQDVVKCKQDKEDDKKDDKKDESKESAKRGSKKHKIHHNKYQQQYQQPQYQYNSAEA